MRKFLVTVNGNSYEVLVEEVDGVQRIQPVAATPVQAVPAPAPAPVTAPVASKPAAPVGGEKITAPMPGSILAVNVQVGQTVEIGDILVVLEAMKMENEIPTPIRGKVLQVAVSKGSTVNTGDVLVVIG